MVSSASDQRIGQADSSNVQLQQALDSNHKLEMELADLQILYENIMEHGVAVEDQLAEKNTELERIQKRLVAELAEAASYVESILPAPLKEAPHTDWRFVPSSELGGDSFGYHWIDDDHFGIYLLDVCGHGVGAALLSVTAINVLRNGAIAGGYILDPGRVLTSMNTSFDMDKQNGMYFTLWYGIFQKSTRTLNYCSGGHPPAVMISWDSDGQANTTCLSTPNMVIGGMQGIEYKKNSCPVPENARLFVFSDGAYEIKKKEGGMLELEEFCEKLALIRPGSDYGLDQLIFELRDMQGSTMFEDDFSLMQIDL